MGDIPKKKMVELRHASDKGRDGTYTGLVAGNKMYEQVYRCIIYIALVSINPRFS